MNTKKYIHQFNQPDTCLVISGWPETDKRGQNNYGIAWYTKETVEPISQKYEVKFVVLSETNHRNQPQLFANGNILVLRVFDQKHPTLFPRILRWLAVFNRVERVFVHSEFCTNGGIKNFVLLLPFLLLIKLFGKKISYFAHNVVTDLTGIAPHLDLNPRSLSFRVLNSGIKFYYIFLGLLCDRIVVMDEEMKRRLIRYVPDKKVFYMPFWIKDNKSALRKAEARKQLGINQNKFMLLYFGFITWYKGADWLIDQVSNKKFANRFPDVELVMAGGEAYSLKDKGYYRKYYREQVVKAHTDKNIRITGFVADKDIPLYFSASDAVVFPYRGLIGSSGALTYAITYKKPFLLSAKMKSVLENSEFEEVLENAGVTKYDLTFGLSEKSFTEAVKRLRNKESLNKLQQVSALLAEKRNFETLINTYYQTLFCADGQKAVSLIRKASHAYSQLVNR